MSRADRVLPFLLGGIWYGKINLVKGGKALSVVMINRWCASYNEHLQSIKEEAENE